MCTIMDSSLKIIFVRAGKEMADHGVHPHKENNHFSSGKKTRKQK